MSIKEVEKEVENYTKKLLKMVNSLPLSEYYRLRTLEYIQHERIDIAPYLEKIIDKQKQNPENEVSSGIANPIYSENIEKNIEIGICDMLGLIESIDYSTDDRLNQLRERIKNRTILQEDIPDLKKYVEKAIGHTVIDHRTLMKDIVSHDMDLLYRTIKNNLEKMVESGESETFDSKKRKTNFLFNPFFSLSNKANNCLIYANKMLEILEEVSMTGELYSLFQDVKEFKDLKPYIIDVLKCEVYQPSFVDMSYFLKNRITSIVEFLHKTGELEKFNSLNNTRLDSIGLEGLSIDIDEVKSILENSSLLGNASTEMLTAMSAFYANRLAKVQGKYGIAGFILKRDDIVSKVFENPDIRFEDLGYTEESVRHKMSIYDSLKRIMIREFKRDCTEDELETIGTKQGENLQSKLRESIKKFARYSSAYKKHYGENFTADLLSVFDKYITEKGIYAQKENDVYTLIYSAILDKSKNIINWGFVREDKDSNNYSESRTLLGFDVKGLNMPLYVHISSQKLQSFMKKITGKKQISVYQGKNDLFVLPNAKGTSSLKLLSTQVLYPITKKQRKYIKKEKTEIEKIKAGGKRRLRASERTLLHFDWLQKGKDRPETIKNEPGSKIYDFEEDRIISSTESTAVVSKKQQEDPDPQDL